VSWCDHLNRVNASAIQLNLVIVKREPVPIRDVVGLLETARQRTNVSEALVDEVFDQKALHIRVEVF